jgi:hypothetical protein
MARVSFRLVALVLTGCVAPASPPVGPGRGQGPTGPSSPPTDARPTNTSITAALPLAAGMMIDLRLPCGIKAYYGPITFSAENQRISVVSRVRTPTGKQVCGGGAFVDRNDVQQAGAGTGCVDGNHDHTANLEYTFAPAAGSSNANPIFLSLWTSNGVGDPAAPDCDVLSLHLDVKAVP